jgi:purine-binding chemotaxis protein CheW
MPAFVVFEAASQPLAVPAADVVQVLRMAATAPVPGAPPWLRGVLNLRGMLVPVVDVASRLGRPPRPARLDAKLLVVSRGARQIALEVDAVIEVRELPDGAFETPEGWGSGLVAGAVKLPDGVVLVQAVDSWLAPAPPARELAAPGIAP